LSKLAFRKHESSPAYGSLSPAKNYYVDVDFPKGDVLRETGIPIHKDATGTRCIEDDDVRAFLKRVFGEKLPVYSYWIT
jgi:hypothetical protein